MFLMNFHGLGSPSWSNFLMFLGCLFQDRFLIVLGSVFGVDLGSILASKSGPNRKKTRLILISIFDASLAENDWLFPRRGAPRGPLICVRVFKKKQWKGSISTTVLIIVQEKSSTVLIIVQILVKSWLFNIIIQINFTLFLSLFRLLLTFAYHCSDYCWIVDFWLSRAHDLTRPGQWPGEFPNSGTM